MKFNGLKLRNFATHEDTFFDAQSPESVFLSGLNKDAGTADSNGSGKSLILDAIMWCLYDQTIRGFGKNGVIGPVQKWASVTSLWTDDTNRDIEITRWRSHPKRGNQVEIKIDGQDLSKVTDIKTTGTNAFIKNIMGMDSVAFLHTTMMTRSRSSLCDAKETERRMLLSHILGLDIIDVGLKKAREDKKEKSKSLSDIQLSITKYETEIIGLSNRLKDAQETFDEARSDNEERNRKIKKRNEKVQNEKNSLNKKLDKLRKKFDSLEEKAAIQREKKTKIRELKDKREKLREKAGEKNDKFSMVDSKYKAYKRSVEGLKKEAGTECPTCGQFVSHAHIRSKLVKFNKENRGLKAKRKNYLEKLNEYRRRISDYTQLIEVERSEQDNDILSEISEIEKKIFSVTQLIKSCTKEKMISFDDKKYISKIESINKKRKLSLSGLEDKRKKYKKVSRLVDIADFWIKGFGAKGLRSMIINSTIKQLEYDSNRRLQELTDGYMTCQWDSLDEQKNGRVVDKLVLNVSTGNSEPKDYHVCSSGEQARVWLATELTLAELKAGIIDTIFADEVFDGLDASGLEKALELVSGDGESRKLICISHRERVKKYFKRHVVVEMKNGRSTIKGEKQ